MDKSIKSNLLVVTIILFFGFISTLLINQSYSERRIFSIVMSVLEVGIVLFIARKQDMSMKELGFCKPIKLIAWGIGIGFSLLPMLLMIVFNGGNMEMMFPQKTTLVMCVLQTLYYFIIVAPSEEIIFRGFILENFSKSFSENMSILFTSFLFAIIHIYNGSVMNIIMAFIISIIYCKVKLLNSNKSLFPCMVGHAINDSLNQWLPYFL